MRILLTTISAGAALFSPLLLAAQDTEPRGPMQWTALNWTGFALQLFLFILAIFVITRLADNGKTERKDR